MIDPIALLLHPALVLIVGALVMFGFPARLRGWVFPLFPAAALALLWIHPDGYIQTLSFASYHLTLAHIDSLARIFGTVFSIVGIVGGIYALHIRDRVQQVAALLYLSGALGLTLAGDFFTAFVFWEVMAISSTFLVWASRTEQSDAAGMRYLAMHFLGGGLLFAGILMHINTTGSIALEAISPSSSASAWLMLIGIGLNTAMPPLHAWISDAYPKATVTGAVFMSALTTKSAIYLLIRLYPGWEALIWMGAIMAIYGSIYALIVDDIREILAFSIISQLGYMVAAIGIGTEMALNGAATHAFSHILYKSLLFMAAGAVIQSTGRHRLSELGGLAGKLRWVMLLYFVGGASIAGAPLFNGFISKSMIISAAGEAHQEWIVLILLGASVGSFLHTGLKLPYFTWIAPPGGRHASHGHSTEPIDAGRIPRNMTIAMILAAGLCIGTGVYPWLLYEQLPYANHYNPFTVYHLVETTQILVLAFAGFYLIKDRLAEWPGITLDVDWFYRKPGHWFGVRLVRVVAEIFSWLSDGLEYIAVSLSEGFRNPLAWLHGKEYRAYRFGPAMGTAMGTVLVVSLILGIYLLFG